MTGTAESTTALSPWWRRTVILVLIAGFAVLIGLSVNSYREAPPIPGRVAGADGRLMFTRDDILAGQQVFLKYGLMENGTWAPMAAKLMRTELEGMKNITVCENVVTIRSAVSAASEAQMEQLAEELIAK